MVREKFMNKLYNIKKRTGLEVDNEIQITAYSQIIPLEVIEFIKNNDKSFNKLYETYYIIYKAKNKNPLYRNLINPYIDIDECAIAISSLITKFLITISKITNLKERADFVEECELQVFNEAIIEYTVYNNKSKLIECANNIREFLESCFKERVSETIEVKHDSKPKNKCTKNYKVKYILPKEMLKNTNK